MKTTQFTLQYWHPASRQLGRNIERVYVNPVNGCEKPDALGYFEKAEIIRERNPNSPDYYERHRWAKGEDVAYEHAGVRWVGDESIRVAVCDAVFAVRKVGLKDNWRAAFAEDSWGFFRALQEMSRGFKYAVCGKYSKDKPTREKAKKTEAANELRQSLVFEFAN